MKPDSRRKNQRANWNSTQRLANMGRSCRSERIRAASKWEIPAKKGNVKTTRLRTCFCVLSACLVGSAPMRAVAEAPPGQAKTICPPTVVEFGNTAAAGQPVLRIGADCRSAALPLLSWDTEGGDRAKCNLLRAGVSLKQRHGEVVGRSDRCG